MSKRLRTLLVVVLAAFAAAMSLGFEPSAASPTADAASIACEDDDDDARDAPIELALAAPDADDDDSDGDGDADGDADATPPLRAASTTPLLVFGVTTTSRFGNRAGIRAAGGYRPTTERPPRA